jgi:predicted molibdopterin-dependent oxidoreductase YjgC
VFGAGGGTSSYEEMERADVIVLWGSNARETHPIFFHRVLRGIRNGARLYVVDPRRTPSAQWADGWLGLDVGSDIALANAIGREILAAGLENRAFIEHATSDFDAYRAAVEPYTLERAQQITGVPAGLIRELAGAYAGAARAQLCWTLGITEHHNAVDNVRALINLALLCGHVGRYGSGVCPLRGQNNVQGGGDMGAIPNKFPGGQDVEDPASIAKFERAWNVSLPREYGWNLTDMFGAIERSELDTLYVVGENPAQSEADQQHAMELLRSLKLLIVQDIFLTRTGELADVVFPATASWCESEGTVTSSERRVQRCRQALAAPGEARDDIAIIAELAHRLGRQWLAYTPQLAWDECRSLSPWHAGMSYERLDRLGGIQWPCYDERHPGEQFLHGRLWAEPLQGPRAPFAAVEHEPPVEALDDEYPIRLTTGRRLDSFNTGVQSGGYASPLRRSETLDISREDAQSYGLVDGDRVRLSSRRGSVVVPIRIDPGLRAGLAFTTFHHNDDVATNLLTIDATDPKSGTAEFKACAVRIDAPA